MNKQSVNAAKHGAEASNGSIGLVQQEGMADGSFRSSSAKKRMEQDKEIVAALRINYTPALFLCCPHKHVYWLSGLSQVEQVITSHNGYL